MFQISQFDQIESHFPPLRITFLWNETDRKRDDRKKRKRDDRTHKKRDDRVDRKRDDRTDKKCDDRTDRKHDALLFIRFYAEENYLS